MKWLAPFTDWLSDLVKGYWSDFIEFMQDFFVGIVDQILTVFADAIVAIPVPDFIHSYSLGNLFINFPPEIVFFLMYLNLPESLSIIAAGFSFRMGRKFLTLFQW